MTKPIAGQRVIITAGAAGIGLAAAAAFLEQGARVFICDVDRTALDAFRKTHPKAGATLADVAETDQVDRLFEEATGFLGGLETRIEDEFDFTPDLGHFAIFGTCGACQQQSEDNS